MRKKGFTLLEVLVVIIIIGILAALALPQYMKTIRKARIAEATSNIGSIRAAELRYAQEYDVIGDLANLDVENPNDRVNRYFTYAVGGVGSSINELTITVTGFKSATQGITVYFTESSGKITISGI